MNKDYAFSTKPKELLFSLLYSACSNSMSEYYNTYVIETHCSSFEVYALPLFDNSGDVTEYVVLGWKRLMN